MASAPAMFQRIMDSLLQKLPSVASNIEDVIVTGRTDEEHLTNLGRALTRLEEAGLRLSKAKCVFVAPKVEFLGYMIDKDELHLTQEKVTAISCVMRNFEHFWEC